MVPRIGRCLKSTDDATKYFPLVSAPVSSGARKNLQPVPASGSIAAVSSRVLLSNGFRQNSAKKLTQSCEYFGHLFRYGSRISFLQPGVFMTQRQIKGYSFGSLACL